MQEIFTDTFKAIRKELGLDRPRDERPLWQRCLSTESVFCQALVACGYLSESQMQRAANRYRLGRSRDGGVIFWQIDDREVLHDGKIMYYQPDCHRDHNHKPTWTSYLMRKAGQLPEDWRPEHCLFGLHLIGHTDLTDHTDNLSPAETMEQREQSQAQLELCRVATEEGYFQMKEIKEMTPSEYVKRSQISAISAGQSESVRSERSVCQNKTICVVESEKTAVMMSELRPNCIWLATGGKTELNVARLKPLQGRRVILFPDTDADGSTYREWYELAQAAGDVYGQPFTVSAILEQHATPSQKQRKIDIADYFFEK